MTEDTKTPSPLRRRTGRDAAFEAELGARIRAARLATRMTQRALGGAVGINYQKLQKYELGKDRIAVSTLRNIAKALGIHPGAFFDEHIEFSAEDPSYAKAALKTAALVQRVRDPRVAKHLRALIAELGEGDPGPEVRLVVPVAATSPQAATKPTRAVVDPLLKLLRQAGGGDAAELAKLLGQALAEAERIMKNSISE